MQVVFKTCANAIDNAIKNKSFGCFYSEKSIETTDIHVHECCEIFFCISGGKTFFIDNRVYEASDGDVFLLNPFEAHKITSEKNEFKRFVIQVHPAFLYNNSTTETALAKGFYTRGENITQRLSLSDDELLKMFEFVKRLESENEFGDDVLKTTTAIELIVFLNFLFNEKNKGKSVPKSFENNTINSALKYINQNYSSRLTLEIIAKNSYVSVNELCRLFKKHLGTTVTKYVLSKRITEAKKMLKDGRSVGDTAQNCGFGDYANFIRTFKKMVGVSPGKYSSQGVN